MTINNNDHRFEMMDWFDITLDDIQDPDDFEMAMEMAHVAGFADGQLEADEHNYTDAIYDGIAQERERIVKLLEEADSACCDLAIALIKGEK